MTVSTRRRGPTERDIDVLRLLLRFRLLTSKQLQRLLVAEGSELTRARRTRAILQRLHERKLIRRLEHRAGRVRVRADGHTYQLTGRGFGVLARLDGIQKHKLSGEPGERFIDHVLAVSDLYVHLVEAEREDEQKTLVEFQAEPRSWRWYHSPSGNRTMIRPDGFAHTAMGRHGYVHFLEIDRATEALPTIHTKCLSYIDYWHSGQEERSLGAFPRVLWVVPSEQRARQITSVIRKLPEEAWPLFAVAVNDAAIPALYGSGTNDYEPP
ncbi:replication-relaxation family protein [Nocardia brasiliensis]